MITMAYTCDLGPGQSLYLENNGEQTAIVLSSSGMGQQQQSTNQFITGTWTAPPELYQAQQSIVIKLQTAQGTHYLQLQGNQLSVISQAPSLDHAQPIPMTAGASASSNSQPSITPMPPMAPLHPMKPMKMGDMEMHAQPMEMRMGNMTLRMNDSSAGDNRQATSHSTTQSKTNFCSQCGTPVQPHDRFCANCGHRLQS